MADAYLTFLENLKRKKGLDLTGYKRPQMERRINSLMRSLRLDDYDEYLSLMERENNHWQKFIDTLTINVSEFYRNPPQWEILIDKILPMLLAGNPSPKIWSAGCSTGEEPYTLAMVLSMNFPNHNFNLISTDIDDEVLSKAKKGIYNEKAVANLPKFYLTKFFKQENGNYTVTDEIKRKIKFSKHNLLRDPFDKNFDLILCRNVVIYFTEETKSELYRRFYGALKQNGVLFTGSTEQIFQAREIGFSLVSSFFYQKK